MANSTEIIVYSDLDLSFTPHPLTGDLVPKTNTAAVIRAVRSIFDMNDYDIPFDATVGPSIKDLLFEPVSATVATLIQTRVGYVFKKYEPRAHLISAVIVPTSDNEGYNITLTFDIVAIGAKNVSTTFYVARIH